MTAHTVRSNAWFWLALVAVAGVLCYLLAPVLTPFLFSAILAYLGNPLVYRLKKAGLPRLVAVIMVFVSACLVMLSLPFIILPLLEDQVSRLGQRWPDYIDWLQGTLLPWLQARLGMVQAIDISSLKQVLAGHWQQVGGAAHWFMKYVSRSGLAMLGWLANLILVPVVTFYLLLDWDRFIGAVQALLPRSIAPQLGRLAAECDTVLATFLRGQLLVMLCLGIVYAAGLWIASIEFALLIGLLAGMVSFVPYLGLLVGILVAGVVGLVQYHEASILVPVLAVFGIGQLLEGFVLTPWLVGDRIGLHPVAVIFAVMAGGQLFGFFGILLALPAAAVILVLLRELHRRYIASELYADGDRAAADRED